MNSAYARKTAAQAQQAPAEKIVVRGIDALILALKASGGYKYRELIQLQDGEELDSFIFNAEARIRWMWHCLEVAEAMLREPPPSMWHPRWDEYCERVKGQFLQAPAAAKQ